MPSLMTQTNGDVIVVYFQDAKILDEVQILKISEELMGIAEKACGGKLLLAFGDVEYMSSAVLGKLMALHKKCKADKTNLKMCEVSATILEVFKITKLDKIFDIHDSEDKAVASYKKKGFFG